MSDEEVLKRADELTAKLKERSDSDKYEKAARILASANAALLITLIWKSFEVTQGISWLAKFSMLFFLIGSLTITLRYIFDYLGDGIDRRPLFQELSDFFDSHKDSIQRARPEEYSAWELLSKAHKLTDKLLFKLSKGNPPPNDLLVCGYVLLDFIAFIISGIAFGIGSLLLFICALAT
ncbi:MAG: hypothetical protein PW788_06090 [Micavibrio sp.]|nr:hypothetical protein [Micavibrio sp.]